MVPLLRRLWTEDAVDHDGPRFHYRGLRVLPKPVAPAALAEAIASVLPAREPLASA